MIADTTRRGSSLRGYTSSEAVLRPPPSLATTGAPDSACSALFLAVASQGSRESKTTISNGSMRSSSSRIRSHRAKLIELEPAASASHSPHETRSSGPEYRAIQTEHRVVQTENRVAVTTRSTPLPSNGAKRASACVPESLLMPGVPAWVQLSKDETQWVLQQLQGLGEKKKIAPRIWAWPAGHP